MSHQLYRHENARRRFFFHVMASLAQMERELILERTRAGLEAARCAGRVGGHRVQAFDLLHDGCREARSRFHEHV